jgi:hypothetical protein
MKRTRTASSFLAALLLSSAAHAKVMPLERLPADKLVALAPLLVHGDIALAESNRDGTMKQVTLILLVRAAPDAVHALITHPGEYEKYVPNVSKSSWTPSENGGTSTWKVDLPIGSFSQTNTYAFEPDGGVLMTCPNPDDDATWRWETHAAGGATVMVLYGYTDVKHSSALVRSFMKKLPVTEHGLALAAQMMLAWNLRKEAEKRAPVAPSLPASGGGFNFLLDRGQVAVMRSHPDGKLHDVSVLDRVYAPIDKIAAAIGKPGEWSKLIPGVESSREISRGGTIRYETSFHVPLVTWSSTWEMMTSATAFDSAAIEGDLTGARARWDLTARGPSETLVVYRVNQQLARSSTAYRTLIQYEPSLDQGLNVAFALVYLRAIRGRAEGWK